MPLKKNHWDSIYDFISILLGMEVQVCPPAYDINYLKTCRLEFEEYCQSKNVLTSGTVEK